MQDSFANMPDSIFPRDVPTTMPWDGHLPWNIKDFDPLYLPRKMDFMKLTAKEGCLYRMIFRMGDRQDNHIRKIVHNIRDGNRSRGSNHE